MTFNACANVKYNFSASKTLTAHGKTDVKRNKRPVKNILVIIHNLTHIIRNNFVDVVFLAYQGKSL